ncbi:MAG: hypothetical protein WA705_07530 [Candidatus Ozemobacteraceae bacterium]
MKRLFVFVLLFVLVAGSSFAEGVTSIAQKEEPYFDGIGFALKGEEAIVVECHIVQVKQTDLKQGTQIGGKVFKGILVFGADAYPLKLVEPSLKAFEADVMELGGKANKEGIAVPIGHVSFKVGMPDIKHITATGKLLIKTEKDGVSGEFGLLLNVPRPPGDQAPKASGGPGSGSSESGK